MKKFHTLLLCIGTFAASYTYAQSTRDLDPTNMRDGETVEYCSSHKKMDEAMKDPEYKAQREAFIAEMSEKKGSNDTEKGTLYKVPVVFHILHNYGSENISDNQIFDALAILNRDFRLQNADANNVKAEFQGLPVDVEIEFVLATKAPNGACFNGITRTVSALTNDGSSGSAQVSAIINGNDVFNGQWAPSKYMNVYVCGEIGGAAGYTFNPSGGSSMYFNGIFVLHNYTGSNGTSSVYTSRTLTHEVGHWLNLSHTWGPNNNPGNASSCNDDDQVTDTPNTIGVTACALNEASCGPLANVENYMDYSYCSKMFTAGQRTRMRNALTSSTAGRNNLWTTTNKDATGANGILTLCKTEFSAPKTLICPGDSVTFSDESYNGATSWTWTFTGGNPASSTVQNPTVTYNTPGIYSVVLTASDGTTNLTETKTSYITVLPASSSLPFYESFENYSTLAASGVWFIKNTPTNEAFEITSTAGFYGSKSVKLKNSSQTGSSYDELLSSPVDLSGVTSAQAVTLSFRYAYRKKVSTNSEKLIVFLTNSCGDDWDQRKTLSGNTLGSITASGDWSPTSQADWVTIHMTNVTSQYWISNFRYKFVFEGSGGNNVFIDDINIYEGPPSDPIVNGTASISENTNLINGLNVFPNPADEELNVEFSLAQNQAVTMEVYDVTGKAVKSASVNGQVGNNVILMPVSELSKGMYFVNIRTNGFSQTLQVVIK